MKQMKKNKFIFSKFNIRLPHKYLAIILLFCISNFVDAQTTTLDSLKTLLSSSESDSQRIILLERLVDEMMNIDLNQALSYAQEGLDLSHQILSLIHI